MDKISENFKHYKKLKKDGFVDYFMDLSSLGKKLSNPITKEIVDADTVPISACNNLPLKKFEKYTFPILEKNNVCSFIDDKLIKRLHPDKIDNAKFWETAVETFPFSPIAGFLSIEDYQKFNGKTLMDFASHINSSLVKLAYQINALDEIDNIFSENPKSKILEIGPGYGSLIAYLNLRKYSLKNYIGIDIHPLFNSKKIIKCDGKNIPSQVPNELDCVYSVNVFQHLSKSQRLSYLKQANLALKDEGKFIFSNYVETPENKDKPYWGIKDKKGRNYCAFFNQFTEVDTLDEVKEMSEKSGFSLETIFNNPEFTNHLCFKLTKID